MSDDIPMVSRPLVHQLVEYLSPLVHWQTFGIHLPCITNSTIEQIEADHQGTERRKLALYATWLTEYSDATWDHVYDALKKERQHELASVLERKLLVSHSAKQLKVEERKVEVKIDTADEIATQLVGLHNRFAQLETNIRDMLDSAITGGQIAIKHISRYLERHLEDEQLILTDSKDIDDLFHKLRPYFSFLDCELIEKIVEQFVQGDVQTKLKEYVTDVEAFEELTTLQELKDAIEQALLPTQSVTPTCEVILKVSKRWRKEKMRCLNKLLEHIFSKKRYLLNHIKLEEGSLCIRFLVPKSQVEMLVALATKHMEFMYLLGVFEMMINNIAILMKDDNEYFTFDSAFLESSQSGNNEAVQFILDLGVNINYSNSEGKTALMLASEAGHEKVVRTLVSGGANINLQDNTGETALMVSKTKEIFLLLLQSNADINILTHRGSTPLIAACVLGHLSVVEMLLVEYNNDPNVQNKEGYTALMYACQNSHQQVVDILLQNGADPNIHDNDGYTALMVASNSDIIEVLLRYNANPHYFITIHGVSIDSLAFAAISGNIECLNILLKHTELSLKSLSMGWYCACFFGHVPIIRWLLNRVDIVSDQTDLIISCVEGDLGSVVDQLMSGKISQDVEFVHRVTPLMMSSSCGHPDIVEALITAGANVNKMDEFGHTALDFAQAAEQDATMNILLQHGGIEGPVPESDEEETTTEEQNLSTDTSQSTIKSSQVSLLI